MKLIGKIFTAIVVMAMFAYFAYTMLYIDNLSGRQFYIVLLIATFMVSIFGKTVAAIITAILGIFAGIFIILSKDDDDDRDKIIPTKRL